VSGMFKYGILTNEPEDIVNNEMTNAVGFYQWLNVFAGKAFFAKDILSSLKDGDFDLIHVRLTPENLSLITGIREKLGESCNTKLAVSMDYRIEAFKNSGFDVKLLKQVLSKADVLFGTEYTICRELEKYTCKVVYELPHPADISKLNAYAEHRKENEYLSIIVDGKVKYTFLDRYWTRKYGLKLRFVFVGNVNPKEVEKLKRKKAQIVVCKSEDELLKEIIKGAIAVPSKAYDYGKMMIYAAATGGTAVGNIHFDASRRCYSVLYIRKERFLNYMPAFRFGLRDTSVVQYIRENAQHKVNHFNWGNMQNRLLSLLIRETGDLRFEKDINSLVTNDGGPVFLKDIYYLYGKKKFSLKRDELGLVCLVKNGMGYIDAFLRHYRFLGVKHMVFVDNGSTDGLLEFLKDQEDVTVYRTELLHKHYENEMRRTIIEALFKNSWCLSVDIDELFDYPSSESVPISGFLGYLNSNHYTAVVSYMLDMFSKGSEDDKEEELTQKYCYYDISNIQKSGYFSQNINYCNYNVLSDKSMKCYYGGVRKSRFNPKGSVYMLIKHPLMFIDEKLEPVTDPHYCNKAYIADVNGVLKHYKFTSEFKDRLNRMVDDYSFYGRNEHEEYLRVLKEEGDIVLYSPSAKKFSTVNQLVEDGFLKVSKKYLNYIKSFKG